MEEEVIESRPSSPHTLNLSPGETSMELFKSGNRELNGHGENGTSKNSHLSHAPDFTPEQSRYLQNLSRTIPQSMAPALTIGDSRTRNEEPHLAISG